MRKLLLVWVFSFSSAHLVASPSHHHGMEMREGMHHEHQQQAKSGIPAMAGPSACSAMEIWDFSMGMCMPLPMKGMPMKMVMVHGNSFFTQDFADQPRGVDAFAVPNMFMVDLGTSLGDRHYLNLDFMGTVERWTFPRKGYPELLQVGEENQQHQPFIDAQHPHSSPVMGLTLSDTISLDRAKDYVKIWFAPRGQSSDGPIAFMHRPTGMVNPEAPLSHHIGQDVGHISSTVLGASVTLAGTTLELSAFNGTEPEPTKVDLPLGTPNSVGVRVTQQFTPWLFAMASAAYVKHPEPHEPELDHVCRYSSSVYTQIPLEQGWQFHNALIWGLITHYDHTDALHSLTEEFWFHNQAKNVWGRIEVLQRTPDELAITGSSNPDQGRWVSAFTLGYTHQVATWNGVTLGVGSSLTQDFIPAQFRSAYGENPVTGRLFLQLGAMKMWG